MRAEEAADTHHRARRRRSEDSHIYMQRKSRKRSKEGQRPSGEEQRSDQERIDTGARDPTTQPSSHQHNRSTSTTGSPVAPRSNSKSASSNHSDSASAAIKRGAEHKLNTLASALLLSLKHSSLTAALQARSLPLYLLTATDRATHVLEAHKLTEAARFARDLHAAVQHLGEVRRDRRAVVVGIEKQHREAKEVWKKFGNVERLKAVIDATQERIMESVRDRVENGLPAEEVQDEEGGWEVRRRYGGQIGRGDGRLGRRFSWPPRV
ncbi:hypothetical protein MMC17_001040 [Xylographa soralifera]|nr:hypothetical protein [Xylographa soralifera]